MKHGIAFRKFSRTSSHRMLMLRNLVTSLFQHERIKTTLPKARDTARLAEQMITLGKNGDRASFHRAQSFLLHPKLASKVFRTFASRYAERPGGYTRIHKYGNRPGDNAPHAILELVDNPHDLRFEMTARAVGWELLSRKLDEQTPTKVAETGVERDVSEVVKTEKQIPWDQTGVLRPRTRLNLQKVLRYRDEQGTQELITKARQHADRIVAKPAAYVGLRERFVSARETRKEAEAAKVTKTAWSPSSTDGQVLRNAQGVLVKPKKTKWYEHLASFRSKPKLGIYTASA